MDIFNDLLQYLLLVTSHSSALNLRWLNTDLLQIMYRLTSTPIKVPLVNDFILLDKPLYSTQSSSD